MLRVFQHEGVGGAGIEPDVENVVDLLPAFVGARAEEALARAFRVPGVGAFLLEGVGDALVDRGIVCRISTEPSPFSLTNTVIGTPQARWREITQSGRLSIMPVMRFSPGGRHPARVLDRGQRAMRARSPVRHWPAMSLSIAMNHCGVLRKITGFFERQECGY